MSKNDVYGNPTYRELQMCYRATDLIRGRIAQLEKEYYELP